MGMVEVLLHAKASYPDDSQAVVGQLTGLFLPFVVIAIIFILTKSDYRRRQDPDEMPLAVRKAGYQSAGAVEESTDSKASTSLIRSEGND